MGYGGETDSTMSGGRRMEQYELEMESGLKLSRQGAQSIVEEVGAVVGQNINMMDRRGYVIASTDETRIGSLHEGARKLIEEHLPELASWTGDWSREQQYSSGQIRWLLKHLQEIQCGRGTGHVLEEMIALSVGRKARILEYFKWHDWMKKGTGLMEAYEKLYGREEDTLRLFWTPPI